LSTTYVDGTTPLDAVHMNALQQKVEKGTANGYPSLDGSGKVPSAQLPAISTVDYAGAYSAGTTYHAGEYVVGADGVTYQCVKDGTVGITPTPWAPAPSIPYGTSLPTAPVDGQETVLVDSVTNPSYQWRLRYNASSSSAYKWEFVGGAASIGRFDTLQNVTAATWTAGAPTFVVPRAGEYFVAWAGTVNSNAGSQIYTSVYLGATLDTTRTATLTNVAGETDFSSPPVRIAIGAGVTVQCAYYASPALSGGFKLRVLSVQPVRVS